MKLISAVVLSFTLAVPAIGAERGLDPKSQAIQSIAEIHEKIEKEGLENVLAKASWPKADPLGQIDLRTEVLGENVFDDCILNPSMNGCGGDLYSPYGTLGQQNMQIKDDGIQIVAVEVLYQTLTFFKVKHWFGKVMNPPGANNNNSGFYTGYGQVPLNYTWQFKVIDPVESAYFADLDTDAVLGALREFRKYTIALLCNNPDPNRMLAMMKKFDLATRFRWDMAWALLGNQLPDTPNKYLVFGAKWRKFSAALDGIQNTSVLRLRGQNGGEIPFDPTSAVSGAVKGAGGSMNTLGYISREIVGLIRLAGDIMASFIDLFCVTDLSVNPKKEGKKQEAVYKLLEIKKKAYDRYGPLRPAIDELNKKASAATGQPVNFYPGPGPDPSTIHWGNPGPTPSPSPSP